MFEPGDFLPDVGAYMGGVGVGLAVFFIAQLLTSGAAVIKRFLS
jgi:hypothetical protein